MSRYERRSPPIWDAIIYMRLGDVWRDIRASNWLGHLGMTSRKSRSTKQRLATFERHNGICHICNQKIFPGQTWEEEHVIALEIGGDDTDENRAPAHTVCHKPKTAQDHKAGAKCKRVRAKHIGAWKSRGQAMPGSKRSRWKKKMDGTTVLR